MKIYTILTKQILPILPADLNQASYFNHFKSDTPKWSSTDCLCRL